MKTIKCTIAPPKFPYTFPQKREDIAFFDIETTGLSAKASSLYLIGAMYYDSTVGQWQLIQWFANDYQSEKKILQSFLDFLEHFQYLYHFNGKTFDIPYVMQKCNRHALTLSQHNSLLLEDNTDTYSIDLLKHIRRLRHALLLDKCSQTALERWLGCERTDTFHGGELIPVYSEYMQQRILASEKAEALEKVLLLHNHDDVEMMLEICSILSYEDYFIQPEKNPIFHQDCLSHGIIHTETDRLTITLPTVIPVPRKITLEANYPQSSLSREEYVSTPPQLPPASLTLDRTECRLTLPLYQGCLKYFYANTKDYYYLPKEDMAVHKSIAEFVEKEYRQKATAANCYTKAEGTFLPCLKPCPKKRKKTEEAPEKLPRFFLTCHDPLSFRQLPENYLQNHPFWQGYLPEEFPAFL